METNYWRTLLAEGLHSEAYQRLQICRLLGEVDIIILRFPAWNSRISSPIKYHSDFQGKSWILKQSPPEETSEVDLLSRSMYPPTLTKDQPCNLRKQNMIIIQGIDRAVMA